MQLAAYLDRIGYSGTPKPDLETFRAVHRGHALSIPYENLDVQLRRPLTRDAADAFGKIVTRRRGGWCYEMNGLLASALEEIGFDVRRLAGAVMRDQAGDSVIGNHLVLLVAIDGEEFIGDVGFGDGLIEPVPLREATLNVGVLAPTLGKIDDGWWRYVNDPKSGGPSFDFNLSVTDERLLEGECQRLQTDPASPFLLNAVAQFWKDNAHYSLRGRVLRRLTRTTDDKTLIESADGYVSTLKTLFGLDLPEAEMLWPAITARHDEIFPDGFDPGRN